MIHGLPTEEVYNLILFMLMKRQGGLVNFKEAEFIQYTGQRVRFGFEKMSEDNSLNVFIIEGD